MNTETRSCARTLRLVVDLDRCTGLGMCEAEAPDFFEIQPDGSLLLLNEHPTQAERAACEAAVASCPTEAIRLVEE